MRRIPADAALAPAPGSLAGRVVLVAGAAGALGSCAALEAGAAGATVVLLGRKVPPLERLYDRLLAVGAPQPAIYPLDLAGASPDDHAALADALARECGRLDGLLLACAHFAALAPFDLTPPAEWLKALHVNLGAAGLLLGACLPLLKRSADAAIVVALDDPATVGRAYWGGYGAAQHGLAGLLAILADELEHGPVRVHGLLPPPIRSALRARAWIADRDPAAEDPARAAAAAAALLGPGGAPWRGAIVDLRAKPHGA